MKDSIGDDDSSQWPQDYADYVAESEVADMCKDIHDWYNGLPNDDREPIEGERRIRAKGRVRHEGKDDQEGVCDAKHSTHDYEDDCHHFVHSQEVYNDTREEQEDRRVEECRKESDEGVNVQLLECHEPDMSFTSTEDAEDRVRTAGILRKPPFTNYGTETGTKASKETSEPKAIDRNCRIGGILGDGWVGYICKLWVTTIQQLVEEQSRLFLIVRV